MSKKLLYAFMFWLAMVAVIGAVEMTLGISMSLGMMIVTLVLGGIPPVVVFSLFGRPDTQTVAAMLRQ